MDDMTGTPKPAKRVYYEKIGEKELELTEELFDVVDDILLWQDNPRLQTRIVTGHVSSEAELEAAIQTTPGYDTLKRSIEQLGQMEPVYVWRPSGEGKFLVLEGATRVTILRELDRRHTTGPKQGNYRRARAKVLPATFSESDRAILLARIHVRSSGVRAWERYIQARFVYETVVGTSTTGQLMNEAQLAEHMEKSPSFVNRLKNAYEFALKFIEYIDSPDAEELARKNFSTLEEISKAKTIGAHLRDYGNSKFDTLRHDVFDMVKNEVFSEYRDARFLHEFHADPDKWEQLRSGEKHAARRLALEVRSNENSPKSKIAAVPQLVRRAIDRGESQFDEEDIEHLQNAVSQISSEVHQGIRPFRVALRQMTQALSEASRADVKDLDSTEMAEFDEALEYFQDLVQRHGGNGQK